MSPTLFRHKGFRAFFFSREEPRMHVHFSSADGEAKFWIEPIVALADSAGLSKSELKQLQKLAEERRDEIEEAWKAHFASLR